MTREKSLRLFWLACMVAVAAVLVWLSVFTPKDGMILTGGPPRVFVILALIAFVGEYVDSSLGMGYGTTITPLLILLGFKPLDIVPAVLLSEFVTGVSAGGMHHVLGNVKFSRGNKASSITAVLAACSVVGTVASVVLAVSLPAQWVKLYIGVMILAIGVFILIFQHRQVKFSYAKITTLGLIAAFNKGISGGGYGPLVTGGQVLVGVREKQAIGVTSLAEGIVCLVGLILYLAIKGGLYWPIAGPLLVGALLSVPAATVTVKVLPEKFLRRSIGYATVFLGVMALVKIVR
jgi:uncharacterized protein